MYVPSSKYPYLRPTLSRQYKLSVKMTSNADISFEPIYQLAGNPEVVANLNKAFSFNSCQLSMVIITIHHSTRNSFSRGYTTTNRMHTAFLI